jgi:hypothetical protein
VLVLVVVLVLDDGVQYAKGIAGLTLFTFFPQNQTVHASEGKGTSTRTTTSTSTI